MEEENKELKRQIKDLEDELKASIKREELLRSPTLEKRSLKEKLKTTKIGKTATNPNTKIGKFVRLPRTAAYMTRHPSLLREILTKGKTTTNKNMFIPIKFFLGDDDVNRTNLLVKKLDKEMLKKGIILAKETDSELRIITTAEPLASIKCRKYIEELGLTSPPRMSFYSSFDQNKKKNVFELEIGKNDVFLTKAWKE